MTKMLIKDHIGVESLAIIENNVCHCTVAAELKELFSLVRIKVKGETFKPHC